MSPPSANLYDLGKVLDELSELIHMARMYMSAVRHTEKLIARNRAVFELSPSFFSLAIESMRDRARTFLMRLFDKHALGIGLDCLLRLVEEMNYQMPNANHTTARNAVKRHRLRLRQLHRPIRAIREHRNMRLAHRDWTLALKGHPPRPASTANDRQIKRALEAAAQIVLQHSLFYDGRSRALCDPPVGWDDLETLLSMAKLGIKTRDDEFGDT